MWGRAFLLAACAAACAAGPVGSAETVSQEELAAGEEKLSLKILQILEHYKQPDPIGIPGASVPEPYPVPDMKQTISFGTTLHFKNTAVHGISKFRVLYINAEIGAMEVHAAMMIDKLQARGNYTMSTWVNRAQGPFTVDVSGLRISAKANLGVERDGKLRAQDIDIDISFNTISMNFENLGLFGSMFQGIVNSVGTFLFDSIKPYILTEAYSKARTEINAKLEEVAGDMQFPNSISPLDMLIADARKKIRESGHDPYFVGDYNATVSIFSVSISNTWITGASSIHRVGNISLAMENNTIIADFEIGTQRMKGTTQWEIAAVGGLVSRAGTASFSLEHVSGRFVLAQPLDTRRAPALRTAHLDVGNIQVRCDGAGTLDYAIEFLVNILPNLLRYQIMDASEGLIKEKVQIMLDKINVEETIKEKLPELDKMQAEEGLKLSAIRGTPIAVQSYDKDEFFNF